LPKFSKKLQSHLTNYPYFLKKQGRGLTKMLINPSW